MASVKTIPPAPDPNDLHFQLTLSQKEAGILHNLLGRHVYGPGDVRDATSSIHFALSNADGFKRNTDVLFTGSVTTTLKG